MSALEKLQALRKDAIWPHDPQDTTDDDVEAYYKYRDAIVSAGPALLELAEAAKAYINGWNDSPAKKGMLQSGTTRFEEMVSALAKLDAIGGDE